MPPPAGPVRAGGGWAVPAAAGLAMFALTLFMPAVLGDPDTFWHVAAGNWIVGHGAVPHVDPFSYTRAGAPWVAHEWLAEVLFALAHRAAGWSGVAALTAAAVGAAFLQLARHLGRWLPGGAVLLLSLMAACCVSPVILARPHALALPFLEAWVAGLFIARAEQRAPSPWLLPVMCIWANLHGGYMLGLLLVLPLGLEALVDAPADALPAWRGTLLRWGAFLLGAVVAAALTPHGPAGLLFPFQLVGIAELSFITEWRPTDFGTLQPLELVLAAGLYVALTRGARLPPVRILMLLGLLHLALSHTRHQALAGMIAPLLLAGPIGAALPLPRPGRARAGWALGGAAAAAGMLVLRLTMPAAPGGNSAVPSAALAHVPPPLAAQPVFNDYGFGGYLISVGIRPFIDGRADLYGPAFLRDYAAATAPNHAVLERLLAAYGIQWTLLPPGSPAAELLDLMPGWCRLHADGVAVVHARSC